MIQCFGFCEQALTTNHMVSFSDTIWLTWLRSGHQSIPRYHLPLDIWYTVFNNIYAKGTVRSILKGTVCRISSLAMTWKMLMTCCTFFFFFFTSIYVNVPAAYKEHIKPVDIVCVWCRTGRWFIQLRDGAVIESAHLHPGHDLPYASSRSALKFHIVFHRTRKYPLRTISSVQNGISLPSGLKWFNCLNMACMV